MPPRSAPYAHSSLLTPFSRHFNIRRLIEEPGRSWRGSADDHARRLVARRLAAGFPFQDFIPLAVFEPRFAVFQAAGAHKQRHGPVAGGFPGPERLPLAIVRTFLPLGNAGA